MRIQDFESDFRGYGLRDWPLELSVREVKVRAAFKRTSRASPE